MLLNGSKTKEMMINFRWKKMATRPVSVLGQDFDVAEE